ncbi:MAG: alkaline phosphatase PhoX [Myxococcota bacterium]
MNRREFLRGSGLLATQAVVGSSLFTLGCDWTWFGALEPPDENGIRLPPGFRSRLLARSGDEVAATGFVWPGAPDGGATFPYEGGWIYVSNSELLFGGGVGALRFSESGELADAYSICSGTRRNCAGGATHWGTWLTCEEVGNGWVFECDPTGVAPPVRRPALGRFQHEAVAVDLEGRLYLTEDRRDGRFYRFLPNAWGRLDAGVLQVAERYDEGRVRWHPVPFPAPPPGVPATRHQVPASTAFNGGEGVVYDRGRVFFTTKGDDRVWRLDIDEQRIEPIYDRATDPLGGVLSGVDNVTVSPAGDLLVAEDPGNLEIVMLREGRALPLLRVVGQTGSELAGPAFDPSGERLYFSSQRGSDGRGLTYEVSGPFERLGAL